MPTPPPLSSALRDRYEGLIMGAELGTAPEVDLHGLPVDEALAILDGAIDSELRQKTEIIRIIYGRGTGKLRQAVLRWLKTQRKRIAYFRESQALHESGAIAYACLADQKRH